MDGKEFFLETMRRSDERDQEGFLAAMSEDCEWVVPGARLRGRDEIRTWLQPFWSGFSSYRHEIRTLVQEGATIAAEGTFRGVNDGVMQTPMGDLPPTGREISFDFLMLADADLESLQCTSCRIYFDQLELLGRLGALPQPATA